MKPEMPKIDLNELLERYRVRFEKRVKSKNYKPYVPRSDAARSKSIFVHSYIVGEHWRRRPSR
jgi:hypothetical protein